MRVKEIEEDAVGDDVDEGERKREREREEGWCVNGWCHSVFTCTSAYEPRVLGADATGTATKRYHESSLQKVPLGCT
jgi:hypothetical protein